MGNTCSHNKDDLVLYFYDEMDDQQRADIEARMVVCSSCKEAFASMESLSLTVPRSPSIEIDATTLDAIRNATSRRLQAEQASYRSRLLIPRLGHRMQWSAIAVAAVAIFFIGRISIDTSSLAPTVASDLASQAHVSDIDFDSDRGLVQIQYESALQTSITGDMSDSRVQALLGRALMDGENPGSRLSAARAVSEANFLGIRPDQSLITALLQVLSTETNGGIKLQTLKALNSLHRSAPVAEDVKQHLVDILLTDANSALRIEALKVLTRSELVSIEMQSVLEAARQDNNPFIRRQATNALIEFEQTTRLEDLN